MSRHRHRHPGPVPRRIRRVTITKRAGARTARRRIITHYTGPRIYRAGCGATSSCTRPTLKFHSAQIIKSSTKPCPGRATFAGHKERKKRKEKNTTETTDVRIRRRGTNDRGVIDERRPITVSQLEIFKTINMSLLAARTCMRAGMVLGIQPTPVIFFKYV